jgi:hypothetical protein
LRHHVVDGIRRVERFSDVDRGRMSIIPLLQVGSLEQEEFIVDPTEFFCGHRDRLGQGNAPAPSGRGETDESNTDQPTPIRQSHASRPMPEFSGARRKCWPRIRV